MYYSFSVVGRVAETLEDIIKEANLKNKDRFWIAEGDKEILYIKFDGKFRRVQEA